MWCECSLRLRSLFFRSAAPVSNSFFGKLGTNLQLAGKVYYGKGAYNHRLAISQEFETGQNEKNELENEHVRLSL